MKLVNPQMDNPFIKKQPLLFDDAGQTRLDWIMMPNWRSINNASFFLQVSGRVVRNWITRNGARAQYV